MVPERRAAPRHHVKLDAEIECKGSSYAGSLTRDASESGILIVTDAEATVGDDVTIRCSLGETTLSVTGTVARRAPREDGSGLAEIAVVLTMPNPLVAEIFRQLERARSSSVSQ